MRTLNYGWCPICRQEAMLCRKGICYVCDGRAHWVMTLPVLPPYILELEHWGRLLAYCGAGVTGW